MLPPVFETLNVASITTLVGTDPVRIYDFDFAPEGVQTPYITWFAGANEPHDNISDAPGGDTDPVQINCYTGPADAGRAQARALGLAVRDALDAAGIHNRVIIQTRETDTKLFRVSLEADFIHHR